MARCCCCCCRFNLLHFRDRDWAAVEGNASLVRDFKITESIAKDVERRLWKRYTTLPDVQVWK